MHFKKYRLSNFLSGKASKLPILAFFLQSVRRVHQESCPKRAIETTLSRHNVAGVCAGMRLSITQSLQGRRRKNAVDSIGNAIQLRSPDTSPSSYAFYCVCNSKALKLASRFAWAELHFRLGLIRNLSLKPIYSPAPASFTLQT